MYLDLSNSDKNTLHPGLLVATLTCRESELIVRSGHSAQSDPAVISEVRRILYEHIGKVPGMAVQQAGIRHRRHQLILP